MFQFSRDYLEDLQFQSVLFKLTSSRSALFLFNLSATDPRYVRLLLVYKSYNAFISAKIIVLQTVFKMEVPVKDLKDMSRQEIKQTYEAFQFDFD